MDTLTMTSAQAKTQLQQLDSVYFEFKQSSFLQRVIEGFIDGILIVTEQGELIHANECAKRICRQLAHGISKHNLVPQEIWHICQFLIEGRSLFPDKTIIFSDQIVASNSTTFRVRVRWLNLAEFEFPCLLVTMEDHCHLQTLAMPTARTSSYAEAQKYDLTPCETKVWLLYRANYTYKKIATELYISLNTVKKHMKNIHAKRQIILATQE